MSALTELARRADPAPVPILEISERRHIPLHVLEQLFASLRRAGVLKSQRGVKGGYSFARSPREVSLLDVVDCVDGAVRPVDGGDVSAGDTFWNAVRNELADQLEAVSVADMVEREARADGAMMFHI